MPRKFSSWAQSHNRQSVGGKIFAARENAVVKQIQDEAKAAGATLANDGRGGLDPNLALRVFRRDKWQCQVPGCKTSKDMIDLDHIGGHPMELEDDPKAVAWLKAEAEKGKRNTEAGIHVLCERHHDFVHSRERAIDHGNEPEPMPR